MHNRLIFLYLLIGQIDDGDYRLPDTDGIVSLRGGSNAKTSALEYSSRPPVSVYGTGYLLVIHA